MAVVSLNSNVPSLLVQRRLAESTERPGKSIVRLSSGLRINRASDDAAGLAVASLLQADARVHAVALRNVSDGMSMLDISEGAARELANILTRQRELATQAANGTLSSTQRQALDNEANALVDEFNRITRTTSFNGLQLLDGSLSKVQIQAGYGEESGINFSLGLALSQTTGDGTFGAESSYATNGFRLNIATADFNGDGFQDVVAGSDLRVYFGSADGTLSQQSILDFPIDLPWGVATGDLDGDGDFDILSADNPNGTLDVFLNNGDGSFQSQVSYVTGSNPVSLTLGDVDDDGALDAVMVTDANEAVTILYGNGSGSFSTPQALAATSTTGGVNGPHYLQLADLNGDGRLDIITANRAPDTLAIFMNQGLRSYAAEVTYASSNQLKAFAVEDVDNDGNLDVLGLGASNGGIVEAYLGNGDGTFQSPNDLLTGLGDVRDLVLEDLNGDGTREILVSSGSQVQSFTPNGDGSYTLNQSYATSTSFAGAIALGDVNGDGGNDLLVSSEAGGGGLSVFLANIGTTSSMAPLNLLTAASAREATDIIDAALERVSAELGNIGSVQSRLSYAFSNLQQSRDTYSEAASRIMDVDVASEAAELVRSRIVREAGAAVLVQSNQLPRLALKLLRDQPDY